MPVTHNSNTGTENHDDGADTSMIVAVLTVNAIPLLGGLCLGWNLGLVLLYYVMEIAVFGVFNIPKIWLANSNSDTSGGDESAHPSVIRRLWHILKFLFWYFAATGILLVISVFVMLGEQQDAPMLQQVDTGTGTQWLETVFETPELALGAAVLVIQRGMKFFDDDAYRQRTIQEQSHSPAVGALLLVIFGGCVLAIWNSQGSTALLLMIISIVIAKTGVELWCASTGKSLTEHLESES